MIEVARQLQSYKNLERRNFSIEHLDATDEKYIIWRERDRLKVKDSKRFDLIFFPPKLVCTKPSHRDFKGFSRKKSCITNTATGKNHA
jgi:hypothetical protein